MSKSAKILPGFYLIVDVVILALAFYGSSYFFFKEGYPEPEWVILASLIFLWLIIGYALKLYHINLNNGFTSRMISYIKTYIIFVALIISLLFFTSKFSQPVNNGLLTFTIGFLVLDTVVNFILINVISRLRRKRENIKYTLVAGSGDLAAKISNYLNSNPDYGYQIKGFLSCGGEECKVNKENVVGSLRDIKQYLSQNAIDEIVIALPYKFSRTNKIKNIIHEADYYGARVSFIPDYMGLFGRNYKFIHDEEMDVVNVRELPLDEIYAAVEKGVFDFVFSAVVLFLLSPVFLLIAVLIKLDSPGPVFYCPVRVGKGGKDFTVYKFRTMSVNDATSGGTLSTQKDDPRITRLGRKLRKYNLDELPQFLNVFLGDMSVVGPRPHRNFLNQQMKEHVDKYMLRYYFKPGITGWAQVNGWRGPTETEEQISQRTSHDLWYIENWSLLFDLKIIWLTVFGRKVHQNAF